MENGEENMLADVTVPAKFLPTPPKLILTCPGLDASGCIHEVSVSVKVPVTNEITGNLKMLEKSLTSIYRDKTKLHLQ